MNSAGRQVKYMVLIATHGFATDHAPQRTVMLFKPTAAGWPDWDIMGHMKTIGMLADETRGS